jgi:hypothetical protein
LELLGDSDNPGPHVVRPSGLMISIDCLRECLVAVEFGRPCDQTDSVRFQGIDVFALPAREVVERLRERIRVAPADGDPASFVAPDLLLSLWRPFEADDPQEEQGYCFNAVLVARPDYYDEPSPEAERPRQSASDG